MKTLTPVITKSRLEEIQQDIINQINDASASPSIVSLGEMLDTVNLALQKFEEPVCYYCKECSRLVSSSEDYCHECVKRG